MFLVAVCSVLSDWAASIFLFFYLTRIFPASEKQNTFFPFTARFSGPTSNNW